MFIYQLMQDSDWTEQNARYKFVEEQAEFLEATADEERDEEHILEEGFDVIQSVFSFFEVMGLTTEEIAVALERHNEKLESRGWDRKAIFRLEVMD